jgi:hypothetical protein
MTRVDPAVHRPKPQALQWRACRPSLSDQTAPHQHLSAGLDRDPERLALAGTAPAGAFLSETWSAGS